LHSTKQKVLVALKVVIPVLRKKKVVIPVAVVLSVAVIIYVLLFLWKTQKTKSISLPSLWKKNSLEFLTVILSEQQKASLHLISSVREDRALFFREYYFKIEIDMWLL
jgi:hypothetical protein